MTLCTSLLQNEEDSRKIKEVVAQDQMKTIQELREVSSVCDHISVSNTVPAHIQVGCDLLLIPCPCTLASRYCVVWTSMFSELRLFPLCLLGGALSRAECPRRDQSASTGVRVTSQSARGGGHREPGIAGTRRRGKGDGRASGREVLRKEGGREGERIEGRGAFSWCGCCDAAG